MKINKKIMSVTLAFLMALSTVMITSPTFATEVKADANPVQITMDKSNKPVGKKVINIEEFSNQDLFDQLENEGYDLQDIFTEEEIQQYIQEDNFRAGKTKLVHYSNGTHRLYLSSAYTKTISALGSGATTIIGGLLGGVGGAALGAFLGSLASQNLDSSKGIYISFKPYYIPSGWGYQ